MSFQHQNNNNPIHNFFPMVAENNSFYLFIFAWWPIASCITLPPPSLSLMDRFLGFLPPLAWFAYISMLLIDTCLSPCGAPTTLLNSLGILNNNNNKKNTMQNQFFATPGFSVFNQAEWPHTFLREFPVLSKHFNNKLHIPPETSILYHKQKWCTKKFTRPNPNPPSGSQNNRKKKSKKKAQTNLLFLFHRLMNTCS